MSALKLTKIGTFPFFPREFLRFRLPYQFFCSDFVEGDTNIYSCQFSQSLAFFGKKRI